MPHQLPLTHAKHAAVVDEGLADFLHALVDDEEYERDAKRNLRPDSEAEPEREDRGQHDPRQRVSHLHVGIKHRRNCRPARTPEADQDARCRTQHKGKDGLP